MAHTFTPEDAKRGAEARNLQREQNRAQMVRRSEALAAVVDETGDLSPEVLTASLRIARLLAADELPDIENWLDAQRAANVAEVLHRIHRLASNQSTSNVAHATMTEEERQERMARLAHVAAGAQGEAPPSPTE